MTEKWKNLQGVEINVVAWLDVSEDEKPTELPPELIKSPSWKPTSPNPYKKRQEDKELLQSIACAAWELFKECVRMAGEIWRRYIQR